ncbi:MAG: hypothetical protein LUG64_07825 [Clostridiales bacterium]|nr:hypothetical protein [Clostridiales bacterium]
MSVPSGSVLRGRHAKPLAEFAVKKRRYRGFNAVSYHYSEKMPFLTDTYLLKSQWYQQLRMCKTTKDRQALSHPGADAALPKDDSFLESFQGKKRIDCPFILKYNRDKAKIFGQKDETT